MVGRCAVAVAALGVLSMIGLSPVQAEARGERIFTIAAEEEPISAIAAGPQGIFLAATRMSTCWLVAVVWFG